MVGIIPLFAVEVLDESHLHALPGFRKRMRWFLENRWDLSRQISYFEKSPGDHGRLLLAIRTRERLTRVLRYLLDENEFLSPHGIRSLSKVHDRQPYAFDVMGQQYRVDYVPGEGNTGLFGGNSNWRGPVWFPLNYLLVESLERYHHFYGDDFKVECPTGSGRFMTLQEVAREISSHLAAPFLPDADGRRPVHGEESRYAQDPHWKDLVLFYEYFHGENGRGVGASHQTGWTSLAVRFLAEKARARRAVDVRAGRRSSATPGVVSSMRPSTPGGDA